MNRQMVGVIALAMMLLAGGVLWWRLAEARENGRAGDQIVAADGKLTEEEKIEKLIKHVEELKDAKFVRNGSEHDCKEAAEHMRRKYKNAGGKIKTAKDFIEQLATKSSISGKPYKIRFKDGTEKESGPYLTEQLKKIEEERKK
jgi:hypothetical protein